MYLEKRPTIFVKDGQVREVFHTVTASELRAKGWVIQGEDELNTSAAPDDEPKAEQSEEGDWIHDDDDVEIDAPDLTKMLKADLVEYANAAGIKIDPHATKAEIIQTIEGSIDDVERG